MRDDLIQKLEELTPSKIVEELNKYIIGQDKAKKAVAIALRNRLRRMKVREDVRDEIAPKNILMIGPTGVGKTEIARRIAKLVNAPFVKVEATKYTEVGYVGRDVESMVRDLVANSVSMVKKEMEKNIEEQANENTINRILDILLPGTRANIEKDEIAKNTWNKMRNKLLAGELDEKEIVVKFNRKEGMGGPIFGVLSNIGMEEIEQQFQSIMEQVMPQRSKERKMKIKQAFKIIKEEEIDKLIDFDKVKEEALERAENLGIIFIDEMDKIASTGSKTGPDVSREGVQRDLLPVVEGTIVNTRYGQIKTDHILFIGAGAFHISKPSDLIPELQGRFPIRIELEHLKEEELKKILVEPKNALIMQYKELLKTENVEIEILPEAIDEIARFAVIANEKTENIGARRLHTIMEKLMEDISFNAEKLSGQKFVIDKNYVIKKLKDTIDNTEIVRYIL